MEPSGYPTYFLSAVIIIGIILIIVRAYWAFLFSVVLCGTFNFSMAVTTRYELLGPYFNIYDALFIIALLSIIRDSESSPWILPRPIVWVLFVIILGILQTLFYHNINYILLRSMRWSITFPLAFFIGANAVINQARAKPFFYAIVIGAVLNAILSFVDYKSMAMSHPAYSAIRMAAAGNLMGVSLLVAASEKTFFPRHSLSVKLIWGAALLFLALTVFFAQWRSIFLGGILSMILLPIILKRWRGFIRGAVLVLVGVPLILITLHFTVPNISVNRMVQRFALITRYLSLDKDIPKEDFSRWRQIQRDLEEWSKGNWLIGRGFGFNAFLPDGADPNIAWGHVGYTSYLSQFGLFGLIIFAIYLPLQILRAGKEVYLANRLGPAANLGLLTVATVVLIAITSLMSTSYLLAIMHSIGFLYGATWSLAYGTRGAGKIGQINSESPDDNLAARRRWQEKNGASRSAASMWCSSRMHYRGARILGPTEAHPPKTMVHSTPVKSGGAVRDLGEVVRAV
jgi:hypothetical protein